MFKVNYLRGKYNKCSAASLMPSHCFQHSPLRFLTLVKAVLKELFFKMKFLKNVLVYVFGVFTFSFCYCFYEDFIHKTILVSQSLPFICISYPLKVFKLNTGILRDSCAVPLLKTLSRLPQSITFLCLILFLMFACNNYLFRAFVTMIQWNSTEVFLNLFAPLDSAMFFLTLSKSMFFELLVLILLVLYLIRSVSAEVSPELYFSHSIQVFLLLTLRESIYGL